MYSVSIAVRPAQVVEQARGFKGLAVTTNNKQYLEPQTGFKSVSIQVPMDGGAFKIKHYR